jgi:hypothetical protein
LWERLFALLEEQPDAKGMIVRLGSLIDLYNWAQKISSLFLMLKNTMDHSNYL